MTKSSELPSHEQAAALPLPADSDYTPVAPEAAPAGTVPYYDSLGRRMNVPAHWVIPTLRAAASGETQS